MIALPRSRNDSCPCGSGRRYKHCHGALDAPPLQSSDEAEAVWRRALQLDPANAEAHFHLGNLLRDRNEPRAAIVEYQRALEAAPRHAGVLNNLGLALEAIGERDLAEARYNEALAAEPRHPDALGNLASVQFAREAYGESVATYERRFSIHHDAPAAVWVRRAIAQQKIGALGDAEASFRKAAELSPDDPRIQANLGTLLVEARRFADAEPALSRAVELEPRHGYALSMLAHARQQRCSWDGLDALFGEINRLLESDAADMPGNINPFTVLAMPVSPLALLRAAQRWATGLAPSTPVPRPALQRTPGERLRIGFVSSDFREHVIARLTAGVFERFNRARVETFGYSLRPSDGLSPGRRIADALEHFIDVSGQPTPAIAQRIRNDRVAILVDLNGYTTHDRAALFALRPAPIQINWLGYLGTLGADWFDYVLTDRFVTPDDQQPFFSERFLHLPDCLLPGDAHRQAAAEAPSRSESGLPPDAFVFCCFNNQYKILPPVFAIWMRLLGRVPGSVLWLSPADDDAIGNLRREASMGNIDPMRLVFAPRVMLPQHLARHSHADLFLDTAPYNAGATANDALWMNVPVVTCARSTMAGRVAGSQLHAIGLPELVTENGADYEALALRLATRPGELAALRARLAANRHTQPLFDTDRYARGFIDALNRISADHGIPPAD